MKPTEIKSGIKRWLRPKTQEDQLRTIEINLRICMFNVSLSILFSVITIILRLARHQ